MQVWRYYLLANRPESADTDFKWSDLAAKNNGELLANLGNFINRGLSFVYAKYGLLSNLYQSLFLPLLSMLFVYARYGPLSNLYSSLDLPLLSMLFVYAKYGPTLQPIVNPPLSMPRMGL